MTYSHWDATFTLTEKTCPNPTDRGKRGVKRSVLTEGHGVPIALPIEGAQRHDMKLTRPTSESLVVERPEPTEEQPQRMCLNKGYDYEAELPNFLHFACGLIAFRAAGLFG